MSTKSSELNDILFWSNGSLGLYKSDAKMLYLSYAK